jgi:aminoglycoside phosphotransferase family enzyme/predicted kinase
MSVPPSQREIVAWLTALAGAPPVETHISLVFLGRRTAWKLRKAVRLSFLDFTDPAARRRFAARELALNAPAAPGLYRDVVPVIRRADGELALGGAHTDPARALDWVVRMARVPAQDFLDRRAAAGGLGPALLTDMADAVAAYHAGCSVIRDGDPAAAMAAIVAGNALAAREAGLDAAAVAGWERAVSTALAPLAPWMAARARGGFVRRGHGDLHLGNLCLWRGRVVPFDALEFDEALARIDVGYDLAFLLMDLDRRAGRVAANAVMNRYIARSGDVGLLAGLAPFLSLRAMIRAHVAARSADPAAEWYLRAAAAYLAPAPVALVAVGGLPGSGKSTLARGLAPGLGRAPGALVLRSDEIRKRLAGVAPETRLPASAYSPAASRAVFRTMARDARRALAAGQTVVADATFLGPAERRAIRRAAGAAPFAGLWLDVPLSVAAARIAGRRGDASDATVAVLRAAAARARRPPRGWARLEARTPAEAAAALRGVGSADAAR